MLGHHEAAVRLGFDDRVADLLQLWNRLPVHLRVPSRGLRAALDDVPRDGAGRQLVPFIGPPAEAVNHGRQRQRRIRRAPRDHHLRPGVQRRSQRERADIGVSAQDAVANLGKRPSALQVAHLVALLQELVDAAQHIVALHHRHLQPRRCLPHRPRAGPRIHAARVGHHRHPALPQPPGDAPHQRREVARITRLRIRLFLFLQDGHGDLGQVVQRQVVERTVLHQPDRRLQPVAPKPLSVTDAYHNPPPPAAGSTPLPART